jgi:hypothetical protein
MTLSADSWTLDGRAGPEFFQRFEAEVTADTIRGHWDRSSDGESWARDFGLAYTRAS